tara:strand:+ start:336 stop:866 length:531 start_codon:yes stop_codon:yes gene_type:complete
MADLFEEVVKATCDRDDAFLTVKLLLRNMIKETLHGRRGKFREDIKAFLFEAAKKRMREQQLEHTMSDGIWRDIDPSNVRFTDYNGILPNAYELDADIPADLRRFIKPNSTHVWLRSDKVIIKVSLHWDEACDAEMAKRTKSTKRPSSANGKEAVEQEEEAKVKPEEVKVKPEVNP